MLITESSRVEGCKGRRGEVAGDAVFFRLDEKAGMPG
jgi:hypothetical protein